jgi:hypothetical protein
VLGVSVALAAEQGVEWWHWRGQVAEARVLITSELARNVNESILRVRTEKCGERRLDELAAILDNASKTGTLPPVGDIGNTAPGLWASGAWESAQGSQAAVHFPRQELASLTAIYKFIQLAVERNAAESVNWSTLFTMVGPGRRLDPASEARLREAMSQARTLNRIIAVNAANIVQDVVALNPPFSSHDLEVIARAEREPLVQSRNNFSFTGYVCAPIEAVPAVYGQGGWKFAPYRADDWLQILAKMKFGSGTH